MPAGHLILINTGVPKFDRGERFKLTHHVGVWKT